MDAAEFADRFFGIFAAAPQQVASELFLQMVLILPTADKRLQLLRHAQNVSVQGLVDTRLQIATCTT
jgi:hypothetical protein